jgi:hypothetical protein
MTHRLLLRTIAQSVPKIRNEPNAAHGVCPRRPRFSRDKLPLNPCQNYETNPRPPKPRTRVGGYAAVHDHPPIISPNLPHRICATDLCQVAPTRTNMGRMTHRFLQQAVAQPEPKIRNEPKAARPGAPRGRMKHRFFVRAGLPLNLCQKYETNPRPQSRCYRISRNCSNSSETQLDESRCHASVGIVQRSSLHDLRKGSVKYWR